VRSAAQELLLLLLKAQRDYTTANVTRLHAT